MNKLEWRMSILGVYGWMGIVELLMCGHCSITKYH